MSWGNVLGSTNPDRALAKILETAEHLGGCVLFADDFDKGFAGWDSNADGGVARRLSQKLLTWMQEHTSDVLMLATVNRLGMLPPELIRRATNLSRDSWWHLDSKDFRVLSLDIS